MKKKEVLESIEKLAEKLGKTAEQLFSYYVKNAKMQKIFWPIELILSLIGLVGGILLVATNFTHDTNFTGLAFAFVILGAIIGAIGLMSFCITIGSFSVFINSFINPEYEALEEIINKL